LHTGNKLLLALGTIALSAVVAPEDAEAQYERQCEELSQRSSAELEQFLKDYPDHACAEVAALLLVERTNPAAEGRSPAIAGRY